MRSLDIITSILLVVGGLNWGLVGLANFDLVAAVLGSIPFLQNAVYVIVGLSAVYQALGWKKIRTANTNTQFAEARG